MENKLILCSWSWLIDLFFNLNEQMSVIAILASHIIREGRERETETNEREHKNETE